MQDKQDKKAKLDQYPYIEGNKIRRDKPKSIETGTKDGIVSATECVTDFINDCNPSNGELI